MADAEDTRLGDAEQTTVAVVGAGMSGLIAARDLHRRGVDVLVLEAADRVGGRMLTETSALGSRLDLGGQWIGHDHQRFAALADELGATRFEMHTAKSPAIVADGRPLSMTSPAVLTAGAALVAAELLSRAPLGDRWNTATMQSWIDRLPSPRARRMLTVLAEVMSCADPDRFSVRAFLRMIRYEGGLAGMVKTHGGAQHSLVAEGAGTLTERIAVELGERVRTGRRVTEIRQSGGEVLLTAGVGVVRARKVVVSVPPPMTRDIGFEPALPPPRIALQQSVRMGSVYKAVAVYETPFWRDRADAEALFLGQPGFGAFDTTAPGGPGHLCMLVGGAEARALDDLDVDGRRDRLLGQLAAHLGAEVKQPASWHEKSWHRDAFVGGGYSTLPIPGTTAGFYPVACAPVGHIHWAGTETAAAHAGYIEGAIEAGERAAREVAALL